MRQERRLNAGLDRALTSTQENNMKPKKWLYFVAFLVCLALPACLEAQTYNVSTLQGFGGAAGANSLNNRGWAAGQANNADNSVSHAAVWIGGSAPIDLGSLGGPDRNSAVAWPVKNNTGVVVGISETNQDNPLAPLNNSFSCWPFFAPGEPTGK